MAGSVEASGEVRAVVNNLSAEATVTVTTKSWIKGWVHDETGLKVKYLKVFLKGTSFLNYTDTNGDYLISNVPAGTYEVDTDDSYTIYKPSSQEVYVASGETKTVNFLIYYIIPPTTTTMISLP